MVSHLYQQEIEGCFTTSSSRLVFQDLLKRTSPLLKELALSFKENPLFKNLYGKEEAKHYQSLAEKMQDDFTDIIILGTGGSSLGTQAFYYDLLDHGFGPAADCPRLHFLESTEPDTLERLLKHLKLANTGVIVISKSGKTTETLAQFLIFLKIWKEALGENVFSQHFLVITEPYLNPLRQIAETKKIPCLECDPKVGGRFSAFSFSSLLPAMAAGLQVEEIFKGAREVLEHTLHTQELQEIQPAIGAALQVMCLLELKRPLSVMLSYTKSLTSFLNWHRQLWAESIGKAHKGSTPVPALGPLDQHSQLQLYLDGPLDKLFTFFLVQASQQGPFISPLEKAPQETSYLFNKTAQEVLEAQCKATYDTLKNHNLPIRLFTFKGLKEREFGALLMHFILETILTAYLLDVNAFDQPAVEESKRLTQAYLSKAE